MNAANPELSRIQTLDAVEKERLAKELLLYATQYTETIPMDVAIETIADQLNLSAADVERYAKALRIPIGGRP